MKALIVEDDFVSRHLLQQMLSPLAECHIAIDGQECLEAFKNAFDEGKPYDLICLDIMMPNVNGREALKNIRIIEGSRGIEGFDSVKVIMTTALDDAKNIVGAFSDQCDAYLVKPIFKEKLFSTLKEFGFKV